MSDAGGPVEALMRSAWACWIGPMKYFQPSGLIFGAKPLTTGITSISRSAPAEIVAAIAPIIIKFGCGSFSQPAASRKTVSRS